MSVDDDEHTSVCDIYIYIYIYIIQLMWQSICHIIM